MFTRPLLLHNHSHSSKSGTKKNNTKFSEILVETSSKDVNQLSELTHEIAAISSDLVNINIEVAEQADLYEAKKEDSNQTPAFKPLSKFNKNPAFKEVCSSDGCHYIGLLKKGKPDGAGCLTLKNGTILRGVFKEGVLQGKGEVFKPTGEILSGFFQCGVLSGYGMLLEKNNSYYLGFFKQGKRHGRGRLIRVDGSIQAGDFKQNQLSSNSVCQLSDGSQIERISNVGEVEQAHLIYSCGSVYSGGIKAGLPHGLGCLVQNDGTQIRGEFDLGRIFHGRIDYLNGSTYEGQLLNGQPHGMGVMCTAQETVLEGYFCHGLLEGEGRRIGLNGEVCQGMFSQGGLVRGQVQLPDGTQLQGRILESISVEQGGVVKKNMQSQTKASTDKSKHRIKVKWPDGRSYIGFVNGGSPEGYGILKWPDGTSYEGTFHRGLPHGEGLMIWPNEDRFAGTFVQGKPKLRLPKM